MVWGTFCLDPFLLNYLRRDYTRKLRGGKKEKKNGRFVLLDIR